MLVDTYFDSLRCSVPTVVLEPAVYVHRIVFHVAVRVFQLQKIYIHVARMLTEISHAYSTHVTNVTLFGNTAKLAQQR